MSEPAWLRFAGPIARRGHHKHQGSHRGLCPGSSGRWPACAARTFRSIARRDMSKLPRVSGAQAVAALQKLGFRVRRQHGSHIILRRDDPFSQTVVPNHRELDTGTLRAIIRQVGVGVDEFNPCSNDALPRSHASPTPCHLRLRRLFRLACCLRSGLAPVSRAGRECGRQ